MDTQVHSEQEQSTIFNGLVGQMIAQGQLIGVPQVPGATDMTGTTPPINYDQGTTDKAPAKAAAPAAPKSAVPGTDQSLTAAVANTGQLIPIAPPVSTTSSSTSDDISSLKKMIGAISGGSSDNPAPSDSGGGGFDIGGMVENAALAFIGWIICTELMRQGKMPKKWWIKGAPIFAAYPEFVKQGYYLWAIPCVKHLRTYPDSLFSRTLCAVFNSRANSIANGATISGTTVTVILWPICWSLGALLWCARVRLDGLSVYGVKG